MPTPVSTTLPPAARLVWRTPSQVQIEIGTRRVVVDGVGTEAVRHLLGHACEQPPGTVALLQRELLQTGLLWPAPGPASGMAGMDGVGDDLRRSPPRPRLAGELAALSVRAGQDASELISARRHCTVVVQGSGRAGPHVAAVLAAAGVGRLHVAEPGTARLHHAVPGGLLPADEGAPLHEAAARAMQRHAPEVDCVPLPFGERPDLIVLAADEPIDAERRTAAHARGCAHLLVSLASDHGSVGPLVLPGLTSCLRCADLHRLDRDPAWNALAVQLALPHRANAANEVALATIVAGLAAAQALDFLDGGRPTTIEGELELHPPDWRIRRRSWPVHPDCDCMSEQVMIKR